MIEKLFKSSFVRRRMLSSHLGIIIQDFALYLDQRGHVLTCIQQYCQVVEHFSNWLGSQKIPLVGVNENIVDRFLHYHLPRCRCSKPASTHFRVYHAALNIFLQFLRQRCLIEDKPLPAISDNEKLVLEHDQHLQEAGGLAFNTRHYLRRYARECLRTYKIKDLSFLSPTDLMGYLQSRSPGLKPSSLRVMAGALRGFLRFLNLRGYVKSHIISGVPHPAPWPKNPPPQILSDEQHQSLLRCFDRTTAAGKRDYAIVQCLCHLGLRTCEVAQLQMSDVDWRHHLLRLNHTKQRKERLIPLPHPVQQALSDHVQHGRPPIKGSSIFVRHRAPFGTPVKVHHVRSAMRRAFQRAGIRSDKIHLLRHTFATRLHRRGVHLKAIADLLGHQNLNITARYARVHLQELRKISLPWAEEKR